MRTARRLLLLTSALVLGCAPFPLQGVESADVIWRQSPDGSVTVHTVLRAGRQCTLLDPRVSATLNGVPMRFTNGSSDPVGGCGAPFFELTLEKPTSAEERGTIIITDGSVELRVGISRLFAERGVRLLPEEPLRPGATYTLGWVPEDEEQAPGGTELALTRDGVLLVRESLPSGGERSVTLPADLAPGPAVLRTSGFSRLSIWECTNLVACSARAEHDLARPVEVAP